MAILLKKLPQNQSFFKTLLKPQYVSSSIIPRTLTSSSESQKKPLSVLFEEAVGLRPKSETIEIEEEGDELKRKLLELETKLIQLKKSEPVKKKKRKGKISAPDQTEKKSKLYSLFEEKDIKKNREEQEDVIRVYNELPVEMVSFVNLLHNKGYLNGANFILRENLVIGSLDEENFC